MRRLLLALVLSASLAACRAPSAPPAPADGGTAASANTAFDPAPLARAEDLRRAGDVAADVRTSHDVVARRRSARALARIADAGSLPGLLAHLADDDAETAAWAAYGLGYACKGREDTHVHALAARGASLSKSVARPEIRGAAEIDVHTAIGRAIGRCAAKDSDQVLVGLLASPAWREAALLGLGDLAGRKKEIDASAMTALLDASRDAALAFYGLSRAEPGLAFAPRVVAAGIAALAKPGEMRLLAIKSLARGARELAKEADANSETKDAIKDAADALLRVVDDAKGFDAGERAEAARGFSGLGGVGRASAAEAVRRLTPDKDAVAIKALVGPEYNVLITLLGSLGDVPPKTAQPSLAALSLLTAPTAPRPGLARRIAELRCGAALALAKGAYDGDGLAKCDAPSSEVAERARLAAILRRPLVGDRRDAFAALARSKHLRVREAAIEAIGQHAELGDLASTLLAEALVDEHAGLVATAADVVTAQPDRARAPTLRALGAALARPWPEDRFETRSALLVAGAALAIPEVRAAAEKACHDPSGVIRERAQSALRTLGTATTCEADHDVTPAKELGHPLDHPVKIVFVTDGGEGTITLEPELSPVTATRLASLARSGFFRGIVVHRVVPGFVVQLGDPDGDGFGGSGTSLRCETSPVPFRPFDVGMALAGRDTGSSQIFVTLARTPHLEGEFTRVGHAEGDWPSIAQGDVVVDTRVLE